MYLEWVKKESYFNTISENTKPNIVVDDSGNAYCCYQSHSKLNSDETYETNKITIFKLTKNGDFSWGKTLDTTDSSNNIDAKIIINKDNEIIIAYVTSGDFSENSENSHRTTTGSSDIVIVKIDTDGNIIWKKQNNTFNTEYTNTSPSLKFDSTSNIYLAFNTTGSAETLIGENDVCVIKFDNECSVLWKKQNSSFNSDIDDLYPKISIDFDDYPIIIYTTSKYASRETNTGGLDIVVLKLNKDTGDLSWIIESDSLNSVGDEGNSSICCDAIGNAYITYTTNNSLSGKSKTSDSDQTDVVVAKIDSVNGTILWTIQDNTFNAGTTNTDPQIFVDYRNYPYIVRSIQGNIMYSSFSSLGISNICVSKFNKDNGNVIFNIYDNKFSTAGSDTIPTIFVDNIGNIYCAFSSNGDFESEETSNFKIAVFKLVVSSKVLLYNIKQIDLEYTVEHTFNKSYYTDPYVTYSVEKITNDTIIPKVLIKDVSTSGFTTTCTLNSQNSADMYSKKVKLFKTYGNAHSLFYIMNNVDLYKSTYSNEIWSEPKKIKISVDEVQNILWYDTENIICSSTDGSLHYTYNNINGNVLYTFTNMNTSSIGNVCVFKNDQVTNILYYLDDGTKAMYLASVSNGVWTNIRIKTFVGFGRLPNLLTYNTKYIIFCLTSTQNLAIFTGRNTVSDSWMQERIIGGDIKNIHNMNVYKIGDRYYMLCSYTSTRNVSQFRMFVFEYNGSAFTISTTRSFLIDMAKAINVSSTYQSNIFNVVYCIEKTKYIIKCKITIGDTPSVTKTNIETQKNVLDSYPNISPIDNYIMLVYGDDNTNTIKQKIYTDEGTIEATINHIYPCEYNLRCVVSGQIDENIT